MDNDSPSLEPETARSPVGLTHAASRCLQAVQLSAMQAYRHDVAQAGTGGLFCFTHPGGQSPGIHGVALKRLLTLALRFLESELLPQLFRLPALSQMHDQAHTTQE